RANLKRVELPRAPSGSVGKLAFPFTVGKHSYRLVAKSPRKEVADLKSAASRLDVRAKIPPVLIAPAQALVIKPSGQDPQIAFHWANPGELTDFVIEIARTRNLKERIIAKPVGHDLAFEMPIGDEAGEVFWR